MFGESEGPLRRSRRQTNNGDKSEGKDRKGSRRFGTLISRLQARVANLEAHNEELIEHNRLLLASADGVKIPKPKLYGLAVPLGGARGLLTSGGGIGVQEPSRQWLEGTANGGNRTKQIYLPPSAKNACHRVMCDEVDLLSLIISFLDIRERSKVSRVSSLWNTPLINQDKNTIDFTNITNRITDRVLLSVACKHSEVDTLCLENCFQLTDASLCEITDHYASELAYLNISYCRKLTDKTINVLAKCRSLRTLIMVGCNNVSIKAVRNLSQTLKSLKIYPTVV
jgi:hypothetical protein